MNIDELKKLVIDTMDDMKAQDIRELDVRGKSSITDIMVIASGSSTRQVKSITSRVAEKVKKAGLTPLGMEGEREGDWIVLDLGDVVLHVMTPQTREFYQLEKLWGDDAPDVSEQDISTSQA
ncbi:MAG: ribosome silencing factor [Gammaproteobacteria bacterium]|nr:ribosome silencing factor [Gammaproteobacteria bacterium]